MDSLFNEEETIEGDDQVKSASYFSADWIKNVLNEGEKWEKEVKKFNEKLEKNINTVIDNLNKVDDELATFTIKNPDNNIGRQSGSKNFTSDFDTVSNGKVQKYSGTDLDSKKVSSNSGRKVSDIQDAVHALQKLAGNEQEVITKVTSEYMTVVKFTMAQARKVWTAAAAWSSGVHKESVEYANALGECAAEQFYTNMEAIH